VRCRNGREYTIRATEERAHEEGRAEERTKAEAEKLKVARNFLNHGVAIDIITESTGLSEAEILKLKPE